jgi:hypothetical protein
MDVICLLCVSLESSTVQLHDAGHTTLKASLLSCNIVSTAECICDDGLQTEDHIFWDCKLYGDQRAAMMAILSEKRKKEYPKSITELLRLEEKGFMQGVSYFINKIPIFINKLKLVM